MENTQKFSVIKKEMSKTDHDEDAGFAHTYTQTRYIVVGEDGKVLDDAQGYGYKSAEAAYRGYWFKAQGGKKKLDKKKREASLFWKKNKEFSKQITEFLEINVNHSPLKGTSF